MFFQLIIFLLPRLTLQHNSNDLLICGEDRIEEMRIDDEMVDVLNKGCLKNLTVVRIPPGITKIDVLASNKAGKVGLYVWSPSGLYDSNLRWHCTDMIVRPRNGKNIMTEIPRAVKHHKAFNSTKDGLPLTAFMITSQNQSASNLYCFLLLQKTEIQQTNRLKRDRPILPFIPMEVESPSSNEDENHLNQNERSKRQEEGLLTRPEPSLSKLWGFTAGFILEIILGSLIFWRYRKAWKRSNTVAILGQKVYNLLSEPEYGRKEKRRQLKKLVKKFTNESEDELLAETSDYSTSAATASSATTETLASETPTTHLSVSAPSPSTSTVTGTEAVSSETGTPFVSPLRNISPEMLSSVKLRPTKSRGPDKQLAYKPNTGLKSAVEKDLLRRRKGLGYAADDDDDNDDGGDDDDDYPPNKHVAPRESKQKPQETKLAPSPSDSSTFGFSPLKSISTEMLSSVKLKPAKTRDKSDQSTDRSVFERLRQSIPQSEYTESSEDNADWNNANLRKK